MKDLDDLMIEMNKIARQQIAVELNEDDKKELLSMLGSTSSSAAGDAELSNCSTIVDFQNCIEIPNNISVSPVKSELVFQSCLTCVTGPATRVPITTPPNCPPIEATLFPIKIVGCIQYIAVADVLFNNVCFVSTENNLRTSTSICPSPAPVSETTGLSASGCLCVDTIVGYTTSQSCVGSPIPCSAIAVCLDPVTVNDFGKLSFSGRFLLPNITDCSVIPSCVPTTCPIA